MGLDSPDIKYTPKKINAGKFGIPPFFRHYCEYCKEPFPDEDTYNEHMAKYHPGEPKVSFGDIKPFNDVAVRDSYPSDEQVRIDNFLTRSDKINKELAEIRKKLDDEIRKINIPFDINKYKLLYESIKCPFCGDVSSSNVLNGDAFLIKAARQDSIYKNNLPSYDTDKDPTDILADQEKFMKNQVESMVKVVWTQILIWILEFLYKIVKPLKHVPGASAIPKSIKRKINKLKNKHSYNSVYSDIESDDKDDSSLDPNITWDTIMGSGVDDNTRCIMHYKHFEQIAYPLVEENDVSKSVMLSLKNGHSEVENGMKVLVNDVAGTKIQHGYECNNKPYNNPNKTYGGSLSDLEPQGRSKMFEIVLDETDKYIKKMNKIFNSWVNNNEMICCFIYNLTTMIPTLRGGKDMRSIIDEIKVLNGMMKFVRIIKLTDYKHSAVKLSNMIVNIVNDLVRNIIKNYIFLLTGYFRDGINMWLSRVYTIKKGQFDRPLKICVPFDKFVKLLPEWFKDITLRLNKYLSSLWDNLIEIPKRSTLSAGVAVDILELDAFIKFLENIQTYLKFWIECSTDEGYTTYVSEVSSDLSTGTDVLQNAKKSSTLYNKQGFIKQQSIESIKSEELDEFYKNFRNNVEPKKSSPWSYAGMKVLLVNFMGVDSSQVDAIITEAQEGNCVCQGGFNPAEIEFIKGIFTHEK